MHYVTEHEFHESSNTTFKTVSSKLQIYIYICIFYSINRIKDLISLAVVVCKKFSQARYTLSLSKLTAFGTSAPKTKSS